MMASRAKKRKNYLFLIGMLLAWMFLFFFSMISMTESKLCTVAPLRRNIATWRGKWRGSSRVSGHPSTAPSCPAEHGVLVWWPKTKAEIKLQSYSFQLSSISQSKTYAMDKHRRKPSNETRILSSPSSLFKLQQIFFIYLFLNKFQKIYILWKKISSDYLNYTLSLKLNSCIRQISFPGQAKEKLLVLIFDLKKDTNVNETQKSDTQP